MQPSTRNSLLAVAGFGTGGLAYGLLSGRGVTDALLWGVGAAVVGAVVLWLTTLSSSSAPPDKPSSH
ncbi:MAG: hypothetical protein ACK50B_10775 [Betaproteobacteria bacterium]|jgi:hypothetical protein